MSEEGWRGWRDLGICESCGRMVSRGELDRERDGTAFPEETAWLDESVLRSHRDRCDDARVRLYTEALAPR